MNNNEDLKRKSSFNYTTFKDAISELENSDKLAIYEAISDYILSGVEPDLKGGIKGIFVLIKPHLNTAQLNNK